MSLLVVVAWQIAVGRNSTTTSAARIALTVHWPGIGSTPITPVFAKWNRYVPAQPVAMAAKIVRRISRRCRISFLLVAAGQGNDAAGRLECAGFLSHVE
jgi:hypothetical protein